MGHCHGQPTPHLEHRHRAKALGLFASDHLRHDGVDQPVAQTAPFHAQLGRKDVDQIARRDHATLDQGLAELLALRRLLLERSG